MHLSYQQTQESPATVSVGKNFSGVPSAAIIATYLPTDQLQALVAAAAFEVEARKRRMQLLAEARTTFHEATINKSYEDLMIECITAHPELFL